MKAKFNETANLIKRRRKALGISQGDLSKILDHTTAFTSALERGIADIPRNKVRRYAKALEVTENTIIKAMMKQRRDSFLTRSKT